MSENNSSQFSPTATDIARDIFLWRRKKLSLAVLFVATATWVLLDVYQFNFVTVASWLIMSVVGSLFFSGNVMRLLGKEPPSMSGLEINEHSAMQMANSVRESCEEGIRWMFWVSAEKEWYVFAGTVAGLWLLSIVGSFSDLSTLLYTGVVMGMSVPVIYVKYEDRIKRYGEGLKVQWRRFCGMVDDRVIKKMKSKLVEKKKEKKVE